MGGDTGAIVGQSIQTVENGVLCVATASLFDCFLAIVHAFELIFDLFQALFPSRPKVGKDSASDDTALFFIPSANPVIALWGMGIRDLESQGIPTSASGGVGAQKQYDLAKAVANDLIKQFSGPNAGKVTFGGVPITGQNLFPLYHQLGFVANHPDSNSLALHERVQLDKLYTDLVTMKLIDPKTGFPPAKPPPPPKCPAGYHWDGTRCVKDPVKPPPPGGPDQDEFQDCCDETQTNLVAIRNAIDGLQAGGGADCCAQVVAALGGLGMVLNSIAIQVGDLRGGVDLTWVNKELATIARELSNIGAGVIPQPLKVDIVASVPLATVNVAPTDTTAIVAQLKALVTEGDVKQTVLDYLTKNGFMTGADAQVISGAGWADAIVGIFRTHGWNALTWALGLVGISYSGGKFHASMGAFENAIAADFAGAVNAALVAGSAPLYPEIKGILDGVVSQLNPAHAPTPGDSGVDGDLLVAKTLAPALIINAVGWLFGYLGWEVSEQLKEYVDLATEITGLVEVKEIKLGQAMQAGPIAAARISAQKLYRQSLPGAGEVTGWHARGLTTQANAQNILSLAGYHDTFHREQIEASYRGLNARQMLRLIETGLFTQADITDELVFSGMRPVSQHRMELAAPYLATASERSQLRAAIEKAYSAGLLSDADVTSRVDGAEHNTDRNSLILEKLHLDEVVTIAKALETEYTAMYQGGLIDHATYTAHLSGMGLEQWKVNALAGVADARRAVTLQRQLDAAERALVRATAAKERQTAMEAFSTGTIDVVALAAALVATGLTAAQAAAWTSLAQLKRKGNLKWAYGLQLSPAAANILKERVTALTDQRHRQLITEIQYGDALKALGITNPWFNALIAKSQATLTPAKNAAVWTVQTS
jgi:hypothetical protein